MVGIDEETRETIYLTRGDETTGKINRLAFYFEIYEIETGKKEKYEFQLDDKITFTVVSKKGYTNYNGWKSVNCRRYEKIPIEE